jgi:hypothetical protein
LRPETLESLLELNELCLALLAEQAAARPLQSSPLLRQFGELWPVLDPAARRRAAGCPYLLLDAGFADPVRWRQPAALGVGDSGNSSYVTFFTLPVAVEVARLVFTYAWHLARSQSAAARLLLGMPAGCATLIAHWSLRQIQALAEAHPEWLRPRWPTRVQVWRELLLAAEAGRSGPRPSLRYASPGVLGLAVRRRWRRAAEHPWGLRSYFASWNSVDGTQPSLPSSSLTFQNMPSFSPLG